MTFIGLLYKSHVPLAIWRSWRDCFKKVQIWTQHRGKALQAALEEDHEDIALVLLESSADPNKVEPQCRHGNPLQVAAVQENISILRRFLDDGVDVNLLGGYYGTALQAASTKGYTDRGCPTVHWLRRQCQRNWRTYGGQQKAVESDLQDNGDFYRSWGQRTMTSNILSSQLKHKASGRQGSSWISVLS